MLLPTQQAGSAAATAFMSSILESIEERRAEAEQKAKGKKDDQVVKTNVKSSDEHRVANEKINAHFFGALKRDENPMATLVASFASALGVTQASGESASEFADRLTDVLDFVEAVGKGRKPFDEEGKPTVTIAMMKVSASDLRDAMNPQTDPKDVKPKAALAARFVMANGLTFEDASTLVDPALKESADKILSVVRFNLPKDTSSIERMTGLRDLGITAREMIEAIRSPWGDAAVKVKNALDEEAAKNNVMTAETVKVLQRVEDVADPKTIEELKAERAEKDPTRVEDDETRAEREEDIKARLVSEKVEDVQEMQETLHEVHQQQSGATGEPAADAATADQVAAAALEVIQTLAAGQDVSERNDEIAEGRATQAAPETTTEPGEPPAIAGERLDPDAQAALAVSLDPESRTDPADATEADILPISIDENKIYAILKKDEAA